jgi:glutamate racemase
MDDLVAQGVKLLVIACNTASAAVFRDARERFTHGAGIPVVEVILPAVRAAARQTRNRRIGVIGTEATVRSHAYVDAFVAAPEITVVQAACPRFVDFVEAGVTSGPDLFAAAEEYLAPLKQAEVDTVLLGCTHYPLMSAAIQFVMGPQVALVSSAEETANDVYRELVEHELLRTTAAPPRHVFEATGVSEAGFLRLARRFLGPEVPAVELVHTGAIPLPWLQRSAPIEGDA